MKPCNCWWCRFQEDMAQKESVVDFYDIALSHENFKRLVSYL